MNLGISLQPPYAIISSRVRRSLALIRCRGLLANNRVRMESHLSLHLNSNTMSLDGSRARELENELLGENGSDLAEAFRAITSMVVE